MIHNFQKEPTSNSYGVPYDGVSVMHYGRNFFSKNGLNTIESKVNMISILPSLVVFNHSTQCASGFSNPNQKVHGIFHFYIVGMYKTDQN